MLKMSQSFAAFRKSILAELQQLLETDNVPDFNAECEDIRRVYEDMRLNPKKGEALADHKKRARINDLVIRRNMFIDTLQTRLALEQNKRIEEYKGEIITEKDGEKDVVVAKFPDGSKAKVARALWINYELYDRV